MRFRKPIYRYLFYAAWLVVIGGIVSLLVSANSKAKTRTCKGVSVSINNGGDKIYVEKDDVLKSIEKASKGSLLNRNTGKINLALLERALEKNPWIRDAEMYFDTKDVLHVTVLERVPVARVFTVNGSSFYMDSAGYKLPLLDAYSAKLPVVTGFTAAKRLNGADSALLQETKEVVQTVSSDPFWSAQIGQIDITADQKFELIPVLGSHVIRLGSGNNAAEKLAKLMVFYKQVLPKAGFAKYSALDLQFNGQVVAVRRGLTSVVDSLQLQKNIEDLMKKKAAEQEPDDVKPATATVATISDGDFAVSSETTDTTTARSARRGFSTTATGGVQATSNKIKATPNRLRSGTDKAVKQTNPIQKPAKTNLTAQKPKAVMQRKQGNE